jgi:DNA-binding transcriptional LysR family regulator
LKTKPLCIEEYLFLTPATGPLAGRAQVTWREAAEAPLCLLTPDMQNRRIIDGVFRSVGAKPAPAVETNSIFNLVSHVSAGQWSAIVPRQLLRFFGVPTGTRAIELVEPTARRTIGLVMSDREPPSPLARNLFAMQFPADIGALIQPPNPLGGNDRKAFR